MQARQPDYVKAFLQMAIYQTSGRGSELNKIKGWFIKHSEVTPAHLNALFQAALARNPDNDAILKNRFYLAFKKYFKQLQVECEAYPAATLRS